MLPTIESENLGILDRDQIKGDASLESVNVSEKGC